MIRRPGPRGRVEGVADDRLYGWVFDPAAAGRPLRLRIEAGGRCVDVVADRYRADVHRAGFGDGACGFSVALHRLGRGGACRVFVAGSGEELPGSPVETGGAGARPMLDARANGLWLRLDASGAPGALTGFCIALDDPRRRPELRLVDAKGAVVSRARAIRPRDDLVGSAFDALHGFALAGAPPRGRLTLAEARDDAPLATIARRARGVWRMQGAD